MPRGGTEDSCKLVWRRGGLVRLIVARVKYRVAEVATDTVQLGPRARWGHAGKLMQPWNVVANVPRDVLVSPADQGRRRVVFHPKKAAT